VFSNTVLDVSSATVQSAVSVYRPDKLLIQSERCKEHVKALIPIRRHSLDKSKDLRRPS